MDSLLDCSDSIRNRPGEGDDAHGSVIGDGVEAA
jgi:hypothetical protein